MLFPIKAQEFKAQQLFSLLGLGFILDLLAMDLVKQFSDEVSYQILSLSVCDTL